MTVGGARQNPGPQRSQVGLAMVLPYVDLQVGQMLREAGVPTEGAGAHQPRHYINNSSRRFLCRRSASPDQDLMVPGRLRVNDLGRQYQQRIRAGDLGVQSTQMG
jgi:hypothetical protein